MSNEENVDIQLRIPSDTLAPLMRLAERAGQPIEAVIAVVLALHIKDDAMTSPIPGEQK